MRRWWRWFVDRFGCESLGTWVTIAGFVALVSVWSCQTRAYAEVWRSNVSLWQHAVRAAPLKPRPRNNYGAYLAQHGLFKNAEQQFRAAMVANTLPHVRSWDRASAAEENAVGARRLADRFQQSRPVRVDDP